MTTATLKYQPKEMKGDFKDAGLELNIHLPNGKTHKVSFNPKNEYTVKVPLKLEFNDDFGKVKVMYENFPQSLLNQYPNELSLVEIEEAPIVQAPAVVQPKSKIKEKQNEKQK